ncbi:MAG: ATP-dependent protease ATPase subunit HslU [Deltaproteobacteria bacterium]|jgi:ATP-dependent HslUV protease ATP-binding subunit HslU|nr:ATP-dependent protease ATPase subunit HslU [Deltaproteobacteria bacterium]
MSTTLTPRQIVAELDKYIVGQQDAKRMVAIAMRNRWRRQQLPEHLREEVAPKNIIMIGPTGVGKTEIARRLAKLCASPFIKVEATKYTEVGYVGRDVESMIRDLMETGVSMVRAEQNELVRAQADAKAEERLLDLLLPGSRPGAQSGGPHRPEASPGYAGGAAGGNGAIDVTPAQHDGASQPDATREKFRNLWRGGRLDDREVEMEVEVSQGPQMEIMSMPGMEQMGGQFKDMFSKIFPGKRKRRHFKVKEAYELLLQEESERLIDQEKVVEIARERVEQTGIVFLDEIDKIAAPDSSQRGGADVSRQGVQRDILPIVEGSTVSTKYGAVRTDHILFIAAGAFHFSKPSDLMPELQGRFPLRVELKALNKEDFLRILTEPHNALTIQYTALLATEGLDVDFSPEALEEIASFAEETNKQTENIGARRLYTIMEKILAELSFNAPDMYGHKMTVDPNYVRSQLKDVQVDADLSRFIL